MTHFNGGIWGEFTDKGVLIDYMYLTRSESIKITYIVKSTKKQKGKSFFHGLLFSF